MHHFAQSNECVTHLGGCGGGAGAGAGAEITGAGATRLGLAISSPGRTNPAHQPKENGHHSLPDQ